MCLSGRDALQQPEVGARLDRELAEEARQREIGRADELADDVHLRHRHNGARKPCRPANRRVCRRVQQKGERLSPMRKMISCVAATLLPSILATASSDAICELTQRPPTMVRRILSRSQAAHGSRKRRLLFPTAVHTILFFCMHAGALPEILPGLQRSVVLHPRPRPREPGPV